MFSRLLPAAHGAALAAALAHVLSIAFITRDISVESIYIACLTYVIAILAAIPFGILLLGLVSLFSIGMSGSFVMFQIAAAMAVTALSFIFFGMEPDSIHLGYLGIALLCAAVAWYRSVYHTMKISNAGDLRPEPEKEGK